MCGISVVLDMAGSRSLVSKLLAMHAAIGHRGPDGEGFVTVDETGTVFRAAKPCQLSVSSLARVGVAFRRLKVCDLTEAAEQPMGNLESGRWIVFNGEIYNFRELRREIEATGRIFRTHGDTEVVLAAYELWGERCFSRFDGMWAIVIIDLRRNCIVVSRDRFGIKPLFWSFDSNGVLLLASEVKQLLAAANGMPRSNRRLVEMHLRGQRYPTLDETFFEGIRSVPPATWCEMGLSASMGPQFRPYWSLADFTAEGNTLSYDDALANAEVILARAVATQRHADVKVGALLSGGLDSSTLVALAHRNSSAKLPTYSLGYRKAAPRFCEMSYVDVMTRRDAIENHETTIDAAWVAENADRVLWALEEPPPAMPAFAQFRLFELCARHGATVVLDGQGSDEITAGYPYHQRAFVKGLLLGGKPMAMWAELREIGRRESRAASAVFADYFIRPYLRRRPRASWIGDSGSHANSEEFMFAASDYGHDRSFLNRQLYFDVRWGNVKIVLGYGDRNAMAHSVEARVPYFDHSFVELLFSLPDSYKIGGGDRKRILRDIARRYVPRDITERADRMGYGTPDEAMIRGPLLETISEAIYDVDFRKSGWINEAEAIRFLVDFQRGCNQDYRALWRMFVLSRWARRFSVKS